MVRNYMRMIMVSLSPVSAFTCIRIYLNTNLLHLNFIDCLCQPNKKIDCLPQYFFLFTYVFYLVFKFIRQSIVLFFAEFVRQYHQK